MMAVRQAHDRANPTEVTAAMMQRCVHARTDLSGALTSLTEKMGHTSQKVNMRSCDKHSEQGMYCVLSQNRPGRAITTSDLPTQWSTPEHFAIVLKCLMLYIVMP